MSELKLVPSDALEAAQEAAQAYASNSHASNTHRAYDWALNDFRKWADKNSINSEPPNDPEIIAAWIAQSAKEGLSVSTIKIFLAAVSRHHREQGFESPTKSCLVKDVWKGIRRSKGAAPKKMKAPLLAEHVALMVRAIRSSDKFLLRDSAILLLGFSGGFRRSELMQIRVTDALFTKRGVIITLRKSKTDQEGKGRRVSIPYIGVDDVCPVLALETWLKAKPKSEFIFGFHPRMVCRIVKKRAKAVGIDPKNLGGHSLRAGFCTSAARAGKAERAIAKITGHKDITTLRSYIREAEAWEDCANGGLLK